LGADQPNKINLISLIKSKEKVMLLSTKVGLLGKSAPKLDFIMLISTQS
jgi:hypothetical protein